MLVLHDTSELRGLTRQMTYQASHDALTGLVNRREFERRLHEAMDSAQTGDAAHALCYLDLDRFKVVNDTCGHTAGDNMLREIATITQRSGARFGHGRAHRRRRIRAAAGGLPAREGAADRRRRGALGRRLSVRLERQDLQCRREHRPRGNRSRRRLDRGHHEFGRFGLLRRQKAGRGARARVFRARGGDRAPQRRDPLAAEAAGRAARQQVRAVLPADRACARQRQSRPGPRGLRAPGRRERPAGGAAGANSSAPPSATA